MCPHSVTLHCTVLYCFALHCTVLHCSALFCTLLHCFALHCTDLYCTVLSCTARPCTEVHWSQCTELCQNIAYCTAPLALTVKLKNCHKSTCWIKYAQLFFWSVEPRGVHSVFSSVLDLLERHKCGWTRWEELYTLYTGRSIYNCLIGDKLKKNNVILQSLVKSIPKKNKQKSLKSVNKVMRLWRRQIVKSFTSSINCTALHILFFVPKVQPKTILFGPVVGGITGLVGLRKPNKV